MSGNKYGMVIDFDSLTALLDILMDAGYKGDENARLLYLSITEAELFDYYLREKEQRENGLKNFKPMEPYTRNDAIYGKSKPVGRLTADGAMLEKCFQMEAHEKDE